MQAYPSVKDAVDSFKSPNIIKPFISLPAPNPVSSDLHQHLLCAPLNHFNILITYIVSVSLLPPGKHLKLNSPDITSRTPLIKRGSRTGSVRTNTNTHNSCLSLSRAAHCISMGEKHISQSSCTKVTSLGNTLLQTYSAIGRISILLLTKSAVPRLDTTVFVGDKR